MKKQNLQTGKQAGFGLIELLVSITLVAIVFAGASRMFINIMFANAAVRDHAVIVSEVQEIVNQYRNMDYTSILDEFSTGYTEITDGQTASTSVSTSNGSATYAVTLTAVRTMSESIPEAVRVTVNVDQSRSKYEDLDYSFETLIAQVS